MKISPFTLIHNRSADSKEKLQSLLEARMQAVQQAEPTLATSLQKQSPRFMETLLSTTFGGSGIGSSNLTEALPNLQRVISELERQPDVMRIGIWDLGARVGRLPQVIEVLNRVQGAFAIFEVEAAIPAGMISRPERVVAWARERLGSLPSKKEREEIESNMIADDFYRRADVVRKDLDLHYLVGITPSMVAFEEEESVHWNYFATYDNRLILASTYDLRKFAQRAGRLFEVAVGGVICSMLLVAVNPRLEYHQDNTGCMFDMNLDRESIVRSIREARIEERCLNLMIPKYRSVAAALNEALRTYQGADPT